MTPADEATFIALWQAATSTAEIGRQLGIPRGTVATRTQRLVAQGKIQTRPRGGVYPRQQALARQDGTLSVQPSIPLGSQRHTAAHQGPPTSPVLQSTPVHPSTPLPTEIAARLLSLLPDIEVMVARERDRQRLLSTPVGTPQHTVKKTCVVEVLYVDLIERYAKAEGGGIEGRRESGVP
jgi:hypothetical protein